MLPDISAQVMTVQATASSCAFQGYCDTGCVAGLHTVPVRYWCSQTGFGGAICDPMCVCRGVIAACHLSSWDKGVEPRLLHPKHAARIKMRFCA